ncbi:MAG: hypothetical protein RL571_1123 [Pseudomonadota bacterium]|jgi:hypothetical protein
MELHREKQKNLENEPKIFSVRLHVLHFLRGLRSGSFLHSLSFVATR